MMAQQKKSAVVAKFGNERVTFPSHAAVGVGEWHLQRGALMSKESFGPIMTHLTATRRRRRRKV
jgi:hypothetical protein